MKNWMFFKKKCVIYTKNYLLKTVMVPAGLNDNIKDIFEYNFINELKDIYNENLYCFYYKNKLKDENINYHICIIKENDMKEINLKKNKVIPQVFLVLEYLAEIEYKEIGLFQIEETIYFADFRENKSLIREYRFGIEEADISHIKELYNIMDLNIEKIKIESKKIENISEKIKAIKYDILENNQKENNRFRYKIEILTLILVNIILVCSFFSLKYKSEKKKLLYLKSAVNNLEDKVKLYEKIDSDVNNLQTENKKLYNLIAEKKYFSDRIVEITNIMPKSTVIEEFIINEEKYEIISGKTQSVIELMKTLNEIEHIKNLKNIGSIEKEGDMEKFNLEGDILK